MDVPLSADKRVHKRLEKGPILKNDLKTLKKELKNIKFGLKNAENGERDDLVKYFKNLVRLLDKSISNFNSSKDYRYFRSLFNQLSKFYKNLTSFTPSFSREHLEQLLEAEEVDGIVYNTIVNNRIRNVLILKGVVNEKYENNRVTLVLQDFVKTLTSEEYENHLKEDITRKLKRNNNNILYTLLLLVKNADINLFSNLDELLLLLSNYQYNDQIQQIVDYVSVSLFYTCKDDTFFIKVVDILLNNISNNKDNERLSTILSHIVYNPYYLDLDLSSSQHHSNNSFIKYRNFKLPNLELLDNKLKLSVDEKERLESKRLSDWDNLINKYIELIKTNCNNKLFTKLQINFIKFTTNLYFKTKNNKLLDVLVTLFNNIKSVTEPHVIYTIQSVVLMFFNPFNSADFGNTTTGSNGDSKEQRYKLDKNVITNVYNNVLDKRAYKLIMVQIVYLIVNSKMELSNFKFNSKFEINENNPYYTLLLFNYFNCLTNTTSNNKEKDDSRNSNITTGSNVNEHRLDLEAFLNSYVNNNENDKDNKGDRDIILKLNNNNNLVYEYNLENYLNLVLTYIRLYEFEDNCLVSKHLEKYYSELDFEDLYKILFVIVVKKLYNKKLLFNLYRRVKYLNNDDLKLLFMFTLSRPENMDYDYVYLKYNFPNYYRSYFSCFTNIISNHTNGSKSDSNSSSTNKTSTTSSNVNKDNNTSSNNVDKELKLENLFQFVDLLNKYNLSMSFLNYVVFNFDKNLVGKELLKLLCEYMLVNYNNFNKCSNSEDYFRIFYNEDVMLLNDSNLYDVYEDKELLENFDIKEKEESISKGKNVTRAELDMIRTYKNYVVYKQKILILNKLVDNYNVILNLFKYKPELFKNNFKSLFLVVVKRVNKINSFEHFNRISLKILFNEIFNKEISEKLMEYFFKCEKLEDGETSSNSSSTDKTSTTTRSKEHHEKVKHEEKEDNNDDKYTKQKIDVEVLLLLLYDNVNKDYLNENFIVFNYIINQLVKDCFSNTSTSASNVNKDKEKETLLDIVHRMLMLMLENKYEFNESIFTYIYYFYKNGRDCTELLNGLSYLVSSENLIYLFHLYFLTHVDLILEVTNLYLSKINLLELMLKEQRLVVNKRNKNVSEDTSSDMNKDSSSNSSSTNKTTTTSNANKDKESELELLEKEQPLMEFEVVKDLNLLDYLTLFQYTSSMSNSTTGSNTTSDGSSNSSSTDKTSTTTRSNNVNKDNYCKNDEEDGIMTLFKLYNCVDNKNLEVFKSYYVKKYKLLDMLKLFNRYFSTFNNENRLSFYKLLESVLFKNNENHEEIVLYLYGNYCYEGYYDNLLKNVELVIRNMDVSKVYKFAYKLQEMYLNMNNNNSSRNSSSTDKTSTTTRNNDNEDNNDNNNNKSLVLLLTIGLLNLKYYESQENKDKEKELLRWNLENVLEVVLRNTDNELINYTEKLLVGLFRFIQLNEEYLSNQVELFFNESLKNRIYIGVLVLLLRYLYNTLSNLNTSNMSNLSNSTGVSNTTTGSNVNKDKDYLYRLINRLLTINNSASTTYYEQLLEKELDTEEFDSYNVSEFEVNSVLMVERILVEFNVELSNLFSLLYLMSRNIVYLCSFKRLVGFLVKKDKSYFNRIYGMVLGNLNPNKEKEESNRSKDKELYYNYNNTNISSNMNMSEDNNSGRNSNITTGSNVNKDNSNYRRDNTISITNSNYKEDRNMVLYYNIHLLNVLIVNYTDELLENSLLDVINVINEYVININSKLKQMTKRVVNSFVGLVSQYSIFQEYRNELVNTLIVPNDANLLSLVECLYNHLDQQRLLKHVQLNYNCNVNFNQDINYSRDSNSSSTNKTSTTTRSTNLGSKRLSIDRETNRSRSKEEKYNEKEENKEDDEKEDPEKKRLGLKMDMSLVNYLILKSMKMSKLKVKMVLISKYLLTRVCTTCNLNYYLNNVISLLLTLLYDPIREIYHNILEIVNLFSYQYNLITYKEDEKEYKDKETSRNKEVEKDDNYLFSEYKYYNDIDEEKYEKDNKDKNKEKEKEGKLQTNVVHRLYKRLEEELGSKKDEDQLLVCNLISNLLVHLNKEYKYRIINGFYQSIVNDLNDGSVSNLSRSNSRNTGSNSNITTGSNVNKHKDSNSNKDKEENENNRGDLLDRVNEYTITNRRLIGYISMFIYLPYSCYEIVKVNMSRIVSVLMELFDYNNVHETVYYCLTSLILTNFETSSLKLSESMDYYDTTTTGSNVNKDTPTSSGSTSFDKDKYCENDEEEYRTNKENKRLIIYYLLYTLYNNFNSDDNEDNNDKVKLILLKLLYLLINPSYVQTTDYPLKNSVDTSKEFFSLTGKENKVLKDEDLEKVIWSYIYLYKFDYSDLISTSVSNLTKGHNIQSILNNMVLTLIQVIFDNLYYNNNINNKLIANNCLKSLLQKYPHYSNSILKQLLNPPLSFTNFDGSGYYVGNTHAGSNVNKDNSRNEYSIYNIINYINRIEEENNENEYSKGSGTLQHVDLTSYNDNEIDEEDEYDEKRVKEEGNKEKYISGKEEHNEDDEMENESDLILVGSCLGIYSCYSVSSNEMKNELKEQLEEVVEFLKGCLKFKKCCQYSLETLTLISNYYSDVLTTTIIPSFLSLFTSSGTTSTTTSEELLLVEEEEESVILSVYYLVFYNNDYFDYIFNKLINIYDTNFESLNDSYTTGNSDNSTNGDSNSSSTNKTSTTTGSNSGNSDNYLDNDEQELLVKKNRMIVKLLLKLCGISGGELILDNKDDFFRLLDLLYYNSNSNTTTSNNTSNTSTFTHAGSNVHKDNSRELFDRNNYYEREKEEDLLDRFIQSISSDNIYKLIYLLIKGILATFSDNSNDYSRNYQKANDVYNENGSEIYFILLVKLLDNKMIINNFMQEYLQFIFHLLSTKSANITTSSNVNKDTTSTESLVDKYTNILFNKLVLINNSKLNIVIDTIHDHLLADPTNVAKLNNEEEKEFFNKQSFILPSGSNVNKVNNNTNLDNYQEHRKKEQDIWVSVIDTCLAYLNNMNNLNLNTNSIEILLVLSYNNVQNFKKHSLKLIGIIIRLLNTLSSANNTGKETRMKLMKLLNNLTMLEVDSYKAITSQLLSTLSKTTFESNLSFLSVNCLYKLFLQLPQKTSSSLSQLLSGYRKDETKEDKRVINNNILILTYTILNNSSLRKEFISFDEDLLVTFIMSNNNNELVLNVVKKLYSSNITNYNTNNNITNNTTNNDSNNSNGFNLLKYEDLILEKMLKRPENLNELDLRLLLEILNENTLKNEKFNQLMEHLKGSHSILYQSFYIQFLYHMTTNLPIQSSETYDLLLNYVNDVNLNNDKNNDKLLKVYEVLLTSKYSKEQHQSIILNQILKINNEHLTGGKLGFVFNNVNLKLLHEGNYINDQTYQFYAQLSNS